MKGIFALAIGGSVFMLVAGPRAQAPVPQTPTFSRDVAPILYKNCVGCHRPGEMAPMSLLTFEQARPYALAISRRVENGSMPPWHAEAAPGMFLNDRRLSATERDTIIRWATTGAPQGDVKDLPPQPTFPQGWSVGTPDAVVTMQAEYEVPASGEIAYQYFQIPTNFTEDKWVQGIEIRPGARSVVHHILVHAREPGGSPRRPPFRQLPGANPAPPRAPQPPEGRPRGVAGSPGSNRGALIATTAPGTNAMMFPPGTALLLRAGSILTLQVHYTADGTVQKDRSSVGFVFAKESPRQEIRSGEFINAQFVLPPGASNERVEASIEFTADSHIWALFPHTHLRGKSWEYTLMYPDGRSEVLLSVPKYDFNWQTYYQYTKPIAVPAGSKLVAVAHYDNSAANRANPDPKVEVRWGEQTWEEMQYTGITYTIDNPQPTTAQANRQ